MAYIENVQSLSIPEFSRTRETEIEARKTLKSFKETLSEFIKDVNELQLKAEDAIEKAITGEVNNIHDVMIAVEKAKTSFELLMEIRNKMLDAYRELMRMQV